MARTTSSFMRDLMREVLRRAADKARPMIPSNTLRRAMTQDRISDFQARLNIPHYWAVYVHDGRGPITKRRGFLVFFKNPKNDPRTAGGVNHPVRVSDIRRLTKQEFQAGLEANRRHLQGGGDPFDVPMIVTRSVRGISGVPFFSVGMVGFVREIGPVIARRFDQYVQEIINTERLFEKDSINIQL